MPRIWHFMTKVGTARFFKNDIMILDDSFGVKFVPFLNPCNGCILFSIKVKGTDWLGFHLFLFFLLYLLPSRLSPTIEFTFVNCHGCHVGWGKNTKFHQICVDDISSSFTVNTPSITRLSCFRNGLHVSRSW